MKNNRKFCFVCGKRTQKLIDGYCECCLRKKPLAVLPKKISIFVCSRCGLIKIGSVWTTDFKKAIEKNMKIFGEIKEMELTKENNIITVMCGGHIQGIDKKEEHKIELEEKKVLCSLCAKKSSGYYEAILQLRSEGDIAKNAENRVESLLSFAVEQLERQDRDAFYRIKRIKEGINLYFSDKRSAEKIARLLKGKGARIKKSYKLVGKKQGKNIYRNIIAVRV